MRDVSPDVPDGFVFVAPSCDVQKTAAKVIAATSEQRAQMGLNDESKLEIRTSPFVPRGQVYVMRAPDVRDDFERTWRDLFRNA